MSEEHHSKAKIIIISVLMALTILSNLCGILALIRRKADGGKLTRMYCSTRLIMSHNFFSRSEQKYKP